MDAFQTIRTKYDAPHWFGYASRGGNHRKFGCSCCRRLPIPDLKRYTKRKARRQLKRELKDRGIESE